MFQQIIIIGRLGEDPDVRTTGSGTTVTNFSVATSERWRDKQTGEQNERTEWHRCVAWNRTGEIAGEYLKKGHIVTVVGTLYTEKYTDKEGIDRYSTKVRVTDLKLMPQGGARDEDGAPRQQSRGNQRSEGSRGGHRQTQQYHGRDEDAAARSGQNADFDDDIPF